MKRPAWRRVAATSKEVALTAGAVVGTLCLLFLVAGVAFDVKPLIVRSGSMEPAIATGALAISRTVPADDLAIGDVVSVENLAGTRVTHRVVEVQHQGDTASLILKGDANGSVDQEVYPVGSAERVVLDVPYLGYVVAWTSGGVGMFLGGVAAAGLLLLAFRPAARRGPRHPPDRPKHVRGREAFWVVVLVAAVGLGGHASIESQMTSALWTDTAALSGFSATTYTVPAVVFTSCTIGGSGSSRTATFSWAGLTSRPITYTGSVATISTSSTTVGGTASNPTFVVAFSTTAGSGNRSKSGAVTVTPRLTASSVWAGTADAGSITISSSGTPSCSA